MGYTINCETWKNDEGSDFATVTIQFDDGSPDQVARFACYFDDWGCASAVEQAASYVAAFEDCQRYTLEERLGPYGLEWEREMEERAA